MRISRRQRHRTPARTPSLQHVGCAIAALASLLPHTATAITTKRAPPANLDFSSLGRIGIAGDFSGISLYEYEAQNGRPPSKNGSESLLAMLPNGALTSLVSTDASIEAMCTFKLSNGELQGVVIGGNFTSLDGTESPAVALYNPDSGKITPLDGLEGQVKALYCDNENDTVYVGGNFKTTDSTNAISWTSKDGWTNLPFAGFNGPVEAVTKASNGHIVFGGRFTGLGNVSGPSEPDSQSINLSTANITADNSASADGVGDPASIVCSSNSDGSTWLVRDGTPGFWNADFGFGFEPTKLRLRNTHRDGRGTKTFRYLAFPINGIMNFTYIDPATGDNRTCTSECPLSDDPSVEFQDFHFVNRVGMNRFQIAISDWYGAGAGLDGIELFQDNIFSYAIDRFNEPACEGVSFPSSASATGPWTHSPSLESSSDYLTLNISSNSQSESASVVFTPNIRESGNYSVNLYTPGCQPDGTCEQRGRVNVTGTMASTDGDADFTTSFYQTNNFDKYDQIYFGYIEKSSDTFKPTVTISPMTGPGTNGQVVVAQRVGFTLINSTGGLNGLYDFDPSKTEVNTSDFESSAINKLGASFDKNTGVKALLSSDDTVFVGGNFTSKKHQNIAAVNQDDEVRHLDGGLNGEVSGMYLDDGKLYVGGNFTNTQTNAVDGMTYAAVYNIEDDTWDALGAGLDGQVQYVVPLQINITDDGPETAIAFNGIFSQINAFADHGDVPADGLAIWVPSKKNWLQNLSGPLPSYSGDLTAAVMDLPNDDVIYAGSITSAQMGTNGAATLTDEGLGQFPVDLQAKKPSSRLERRDTLTEGGAISGVVAGLFYDDDGKNLTVLAGHFSVKSNDSTIHNLVIVDGKDDDAVSGLGDGISEDSTYAALAVSGSTLFAGGSISGNASGVEIGGIVAYDLESKSFAEQPSSISGANGTVSAISVRPDRDSEVFVGGSFTRAGALDCPGICLYNTDSMQWVRPGNRVGGDIYCLMWTSKKTLLVGGDLKNGSDQTPLAVYKPDDEAWESFPGASEVPGPVHAATPASSDSEKIWVAGITRKDGSLFLMKHDGDEWRTVKQSLGSNTVIRGLQSFTTTKSHEKVDLLDDDQVLMLTGSIELPNFGMASAVIYNGTDFLPYAITTSSTSDPGSIGQIFSQKDNFFSSSGKHLALGFVVLIGLGISLGIILLMVVAGIVLDRLRKKREGYVPAPTSMYDRGSGMRRIPPGELFESLSKGRSGVPRV